MAFLSFREWAAPRCLLFREAQLLRDQPMTWAAAMMTRVTAPGREIRDRCPESTSVMWALARLDMNSCSAGGVTGSAGPISGQEASALHRGVYQRSESVLTALGES